MTTPLHERLLAAMGGETWPRGVAVAYLRRRGMGADEAAGIVASLLASGHLLDVGGSVRQPGRSPEEKIAWSVWTLVPPGVVGATADQVGARMDLSPEELRAALDLLVARGCLIRHGRTYHRGQVRP